MRFLSNAEMEAGGGVVFLVSVFEIHFQGMQT